MNSLLIPVGHPTMRLKDILPSKSASFSPNLHRWMKLQGHAYTDGGVAETVYRILPNSRLAKAYGDGTLMIGSPYNDHEGDMDFSGALLIDVLCNGSKASRGGYLGAVPSLEVVKDFWDNYMKVGRCAIDPEHNEHFRDSNRYRVTGDVRTCLWCGATHSKVMTPRTVFDESWVTVKGDD